MDELKDNIVKLEKELTLQKEMLEHIIKLLQEIHCRVYTSK